jgi:tRNA-splicing ligase RtcB
MSISPIVKRWLIEPLPKDVAAALDRLAASDDVRRVAVMPDVHLANDVCVGTVLATSHLIYPAAVGGDIGCGVAAVAFDCSADVLNDEDRAASVLDGLRRGVPGNRHRRETLPEMPEELARANLSDERFLRLLRRDGRVQFGTLGRGNHFLEFQADEEDRLWLMVHSGSRAMGPAIRDAHLAAAVKGSRGLFHLDSRDAAGLAYLADMQWARGYARGNRRAMVNAAARLLFDVTGTAVDWDSLFDCDHNHVQWEIHFGEPLWVHRKGAASAKLGELASLPGSMGTQSFHVEGRGHEPALCSSAHGAGRAMSRQRAARAVSTRDVFRELQGVWFDTRAAPLLRDEAPSAYKDVKAVLRAQRDITRVVRMLRPVLSYKAV